jgi:hypothetical protein
VARQFEEDDQNFEGLERHGVSLGRDARAAELIE